MGVSREFVTGAAPQASPRPVTKESDPFSNYVVVFRLKRNVARYKRVN